MVAVFIDEGDDDKSRPMQQRLRRGSVASVACLLVEGFIAQRFNV